jgi:hypothetical protein
MSKEIATQSLSPCLYSILQLAVFGCCPSTTLVSTRLANGGIQDIVPSVPALIFRSTRNQSGKCTPILVDVRLYRIFQHAAFVFFPFTALLPPVRAMRGFKTSCHLLQHCFFCSTRNQSGNHTPLLVTVRLYRMFQLYIFDR